MITYTHVLEGVDSMDNKLINFYTKLSKNEVLVEKLREKIEKLKMKTNSKN